VDVGIFEEQRCSVVVHGCATYPSHSETPPFYFRLTSALTPTCWMAIPALRGVAVGS
jgi:hypothetical protein